MFIPTESQKHRHVETEQKGEMYRQSESQKQRCRDIGVDRYIQRRRYRYIETDSLRQSQRHRDVVTDE